MMDRGTVPGSGWKSWSWSQAVSKPVWHIPLLCVQWKTPDDGQRNCLKHAEFHSKNKFEKLVHLVGFIIRNLTRCTVTWTSNLSRGPYFIWHTRISFASSCRLAYRTNVAYPSDRPEAPRTRGGKRKTTVDRKTTETVLLHTVWGLIGLDPWRAREKHSASLKTFIGQYTFPNAYTRIVCPFFLRIRVLGCYPMSLGA